MQTTVPALEQELLSEVKAKGVVKIDNCFDLAAVLRMRNELLSVYSKMKDGDELPFAVDQTGRVVMERAIPNGYLFGKSVTIDRRFLPWFGTLNAAFTAAWFKNFTDQFYGVPNNWNLQTFCTYEYIKDQNQEGKPRNSFFHFDPYPALKFFIYLTDVDEDSGAFRAIPGSHIDGRNCRTSRPFEEVKALGYRLDQNPELNRKYSEDQAVAFTGRAGTLIIVDTDTIHAGGSIRRDGARRMVAINHNRKN